MDHVVAAAADVGCVTLFVVAPCLGSVLDIVTGGCALWCGATRLKPAHPGSNGCRYMFTGILRVSKDSLLQRVHGAVYRTNSTMLNKILHLLARA